MTSQNSITNKKRSGFLPLFSFTARQYWTTVLLFAIILFFVIPIPVMMVISDRNLENTDMLMRTRLMLVNTWADGIRFVIIPLLSAFGVVVSLSRFSYLKNKVSIDFYHSLPVKRGQLYITQLAVSAVSLIIPYVFNILFTLIVVGINGLMSGGLLLALLKISLEAAVYTMFFYSLSTLVGMVSGLGAVQLTLTAVAMFIVPGTYLVTFTFINIFNENMWLAYYFDQGFFEASSPVLRFLLDQTALSIPEAIIMLLVSAAMLAGAYLIYMYRKSERAGIPVVFNALGEVIKYILMFVGTLCGGLLFYFIMDDFLWTVFGMICGMVLVFMLTNTILHKTVRAMFKGWKGLCIFGAASTVVFIMLLTNAFGINTNVPSPTFTSRVSVSFEDSGEIEFRDKDVIKALYTIYTEGATSDYIGSRSNGLYHSNNMYIEIVFYPTIGVPTAKSARIYNKSDFIDEMRIVLDSEEFKEQYSTAFDRIGENGWISVNTPRYTFNSEKTQIFETYTRQSYQRFDKSVLFSARAEQFDLDLIAEADKNCSFDYFQQQSFGSVCIDSSSAEAYTAVEHPLLISMTDVIDTYIEKKYMGVTPEELCTNLARVISSIEVYKYSENDTEIFEVTDKMQILEILTASSNPLGKYYTPFTFTDDEYCAYYTVEVTDAFEETYYVDSSGDQNVTVTELPDEEKRTYDYTADLAFIYDKVPEFIIEHFAK